MKRAHTPKDFGEVFVDLGTIREYTEEEEEESMITGMTLATYHTSPA